MCKAVERRNCIVIGLQCDGTNNQLWFPSVTRPQPPQHSNRLDRRPVHLWRSVLSLQQHWWFIGPCKGIQEYIIPEIQKCKLRSTVYHIGGSSRINLKRGKKISEFSKKPTELDKTLCQIVSGLNTKCVIVKDHHPKNIQVCIRF